MAIERCDLCFEFQQIFGMLSPLPDNIDEHRQPVLYCKSCYMRIWRMTFVDEPLYPRKYEGLKSS